MRAISPCWHLKTSFSLWIYYCVGMLGWKALVSAVAEEALNMLFYQFTSL